MSKQWLESEFSLLYGVVFSLTHDTFCSSSGMLILLQAVHLSSTIPSAIWVGVEEEERLKPHSSSWRLGKEWYISTKTSDTNGNVCWTSEQYRFFSKKFGSPVLNRMYRCDVGAAQLCEGDLVHVRLQNPASEICLINFSELLLWGWQGHLDANFLCHVVQYWRIPESMKKFINRADITNTSFNEQLLGNVRVSLLCKACNLIQCDTPTRLRDVIEARGSGNCPNCGARGIYWERYQLKIIPSVFWAGWCFVINSIDTKISSPIGTFEPQEMSLNHIEPFLDPSKPTQLLFRAFEGNQVSNTYQTLCASHRISRLVCDHTISIGFDR